MIAFDEDGRVELEPVACPSHGREAMVNAGAPNVVRCCICGVVYERCDNCLGNPAYQPTPKQAPVFCNVCTSSPTPGWQPRKGKWSTPYIVY